MPVSGPVLFVIGLSILFLAFPAAYLYMIVRERNLIRRLFDR